MKKTIFSLFKGFFVFAAILFSYFYLDNIWNKFKEKEEQEFPSAVDLGHGNIKGVVVKKRESLYVRMRNLVELSNGVKFRFYTFTGNKRYSPADLDEFLQKGDSIYKPAGSDSIYIYRYSKEYYFILGKLINEK